MRAFSCYASVIRTGLVRENLSLTHLVSALRIIWRLQKSSVEQLMLAISLNLAEAQIRVLTGRCWVSIMRICLLSLHGRGHALRLSPYAIHDNSVIKSSLRSQEGKLDQTSQCIHINKTPHEECTQEGIFLQ